MRSGFSLVELSIVLVILGLLTGGILTGQSLIRAAELRSITTDITKYQTAFYIFRDKYFQLPGDMNNATDFWGAINSTLSTCIGQTSPDGKLTCNGNADGQINQNGGEYSERFHTWIHLANAGLIEGSYTGYTAGASGTVTIDPGVNIPGSKINGSGWSVSYVGGLPTGDTQTYPGAFGNVFALSPPGSASVSRILTADEMWNIDTKMDDGIPSKGKIFSNRAGPTGTWAPDCATDDDAELAKYNLSETAKVCRFNVKSGF